MHITRTGRNCYTVFTSVMLSDFTMQADTAMGLEGEELRPIIAKGNIRISQFRVKLRPKALKRVQALAIGETVTLDK